MRISHSSYQKYINSLLEEIRGEKLYSPLLLNNKSLLFPFVEKNKEVLFINLNPKCPLVYETTNDLFFSSFENNFLNRFRKYYGKSEIQNISLKEDDLIIKLDLYSLDNDVNFSLMIELIPNSPNIFVLDEKGIVKDHFFKFKNRAFNVGEEYIYPTNEKLIEGEIEISPKLIEEKTAEEIEIRSKEKYATFIKFLNSKIKGIERKINAIENDIEIAGKNLIYQEIADDIFASGIDLKSHQNSYKYDGKVYELDPAKTLLENAQHFYHKTKKAKQTMDRAKINIDNASKEIAEYRHIFEQFEAANELKKDELLALYTNNKKKKETKPTFLNRPWKVNLNGTIIYFGRNASQNDYLSFVMKLDREFTWMHIKDKSGAHLVIANKKPTENELITTAEIALLCSRASAGEVSFTKKKNVRRGHVLGEALLKNYSLIKLNNIRKETIALFEKAVRLD